VCVGVSMPMRNNVSNILTKLQVAHRAQAIVRAREAGLGAGRPAVNSPLTSSTHTRPRLIV
jgi:hypothetical protein